LYSPADAQAKYLKNNFKFCIKINIKTAQTCLSAVTLSSRSALFVLAKVTDVKAANYITPVCGDVAECVIGSLFVYVNYTARKYTSVQRTQTNRDPITHSATSPHTDVT